MRKLAIFFLLVLFSTTGVFAKPVPGYEENIGKGWKISFEDKPEFAEQGFDDSTWKNIDLPGILTDQKKHQVIWLRKSFKMPQQLVGTETAFALGKVWDVEKTYLNGSIIGSAGREYPNFMSRWNQFRFYALPDKYINYSGDNVIAIRIFCNQVAMYNGQPIVTTLERAQEITFNRRLVAEYIPFGISLFILLFGFVLFFQYFFYRTSHLYLHFFVMAILWFVMSLHYYYPYIESISYNMRDNLYYALLSLSFISFYVFLENLLNQKTGIMRWIFSIVCSIVSVVCLTATPQDPVTGWRFSFISGFTLFFLLSSAYVIFKALRKKNREAIITLVGFSFLVFAAVHDALMISGVIYSDYYYNYICFPILILSQGTVLSWRNAFTARQLDDYSKNLENKVAERTAELTTANQKIAHAFKEIEEAHTIMKLDMKMAVNVQKSFFAKQAPQSPDWDIAFVNKPMSGVSGDFYDFYMRDDRVEGVSIMDVSGHGIASGLVTMVAKSIFARCMNSMPDVKLGEVMEEANKELVTELGSIENYLTGIMLRFNGAMVEYVNAGHTDLLYKTAGSKEIQVVEPNDKREFKGLFLGVEAMMSKYNTLKFEMSKNDIILLYSDCLIESVNKENEEYGIERVIKSLGRISSLSSSRDMLDKIIDDLYNFTETRGLNDDLTVMLIKRVN